MKNSKVLIYRNENELKPTGGPNGYLYNLKKGLKGLEIDNIYFLNKEIKSSKGNKKNIKNFLKKIYNIQPKFIKKIYKNYLALKYLNSLINWKEKYENENLNDYDFIHFHSTLQMYSEKDRLLEYKGKVILTSHSPKPSHIEKLDDILDEDISEKVKKKYKKLEEIDEYAFNNANYIFFPCKEAEEPYFNQWDKYANLKEKNKEKYRYILTGTIGCNTKVSKEEIRKKYNIPNNAFLICYVGRHNEVKGYDILKEIAKKVLKDNKDIYFIIAGKEGPLYKIENEKWIEVGWTNDPHSIIGASDLFILPNRETYFDLILLEVMSLGIPILASYTGGNKYFKKYENSGIQFFKNEQDAITKIMNLSKLSKSEIEDIGNRNKKIYEQNFNEEKFAKNYIELIESLKGD